MCIPIILEARLDYGHQKSILPWLKDLSPRLESSYGTYIVQKLTLRLKSARSNKDSSIYYSPSIFHELDNMATFTDGDEYASYSECLQSIDSYIMCQLKHSYIKHLLLVTFSPLGRNRYTSPTHRGLTWLSNVMSPFIITCFSCPVLSLLYI